MLHKEFEEIRQDYLFPPFFHKCENCITSHKICDRYFDVDDYAFLRAGDFVVV